MQQSIFLKIKKQDLETMKSLFSLLLLASFFFSLWLSFVAFVASQKTNERSLLQPNFIGKIPSNAIQQFYPGGQYIVLTFSGGPHHDITPQILNTLANYSVHATFFVSGQKAMHSPELLRKILAEGHNLGHQGFYNSQQMSKKTKEEITELVTATESLLKNETKKEISYFRPPGFQISQSLSDWISSSSASTVKTIFWSLDLNQLLKSETDLSPKYIKELIMKTSKPGDIINCQDHKLTLKILQPLLEGLRAAKFELVTLDQILSFPDDKPH